MATEIYVNIKDLPVLSEISNGDYILVETSTGTHTIDFQDFLIPTENTVLTTIVEQNATALATTTTNLETLTSQFESLSADLTTGINNINNIITTSTTDYSSLSTKVDSVSSNLTTLVSRASSTLDTNINLISTQLSDIFINSKQISIATGLNTVSDVLFYGRTDIQAKHIFISPYNEMAAKCPAYIQNVNYTTGMITVKALTASVPADAIYNIFVIKTV